MSSSWLLLLVVQASSEEVIAEYIERGPDTLRDVGCCLVIFLIISEIVDSEGLVCLILKEGGSEINKKKNIRRQVECAVQSYSASCKILTVFINYIIKLQ